MQAAFAGWVPPRPALRLECDNVIPHGRGLGSSSAAIIAGVCARPGAGGGRLAADGRRRGARARGGPRGPPRQRRAGAVRRLHDRLPRRRPVPGGDARRRPAGAGGRVRAAARRRDVGRARAAAGRRTRTRTRPPTPAARRCSWRRWPGGPSCCSPPPRTGSTRTPASRRCLHPSSWCGALRADGLPGGGLGAGPTVLVLTDGRQQPAVARRAPDGWRALVVPSTGRAPGSTCRRRRPGGSAAPERRSRDCGG